MSAPPADAPPTPSVHTLDPPGPVRAVALVLPGGRANSFEPHESNQLAAARMVPFARHLARRGRRRGLAVWTVRYRYRGWNDAAASPVADTEWALDEVRRRHGEVPVVIVGHSMGGRTALRVAGGDAVRGVVALAPWTPEGEPVQQLAGRTVLIAHGSLDVITSARLSRRFADRARPVAGEVWWVRVRLDIHGLLFRWPTWHRLTTSFALYALGWEGRPRRLTRSADARIPTVVEI